MISLYNYVICGTLEWEHVYFWENIWWWVMWLSNTNVLIMIIDMLGCAIEIGSSTRQWHPIKGIGRWLSPIYIISTCFHIHIRVPFQFFFITSLYKKGRTTNWVINTCELRNEFPYVPCWNDVPITTQGNFKHYRQF